MTAVRLLITAFIAVLLVLIVLGLMWTGANQPAPQSIASRLVLGISGLAGVLALAAIWRHNPSRTAARK